MFRTRVFGGTPDAFHLACEWGPEAVSGGSKLPTPEALARMELDWTSNVADTQVLERYVQRQSALLSEQAQERVRVELAVHDPQQRQVVSVALRVVCTPPVLRSLAFTRAAGSGSVPESLVRGLLQHMDLSHVWKVRGCEGLPPHFWASCVEASRWRSLFNLNLSSCGLTALPAAVGQLAPLHVLRLNHNKLTSLPPELGLLSELEVLWCNHNGLTTLPAELRQCTALRELHLEHNRLATPLLDLSHASALESLQLYGNPLEFLPELAPAVSLRSLSLANLRVMADTSFTRWQVEVTSPSGSSYTSMVMGGRGHKLLPLFNLTFRRSSIQHPLLAGALGRLVEDPSNLALLVKEDVALQQLVLAAMGSNALVVQQAVKVMVAAGAYADAAQRLVKHNVVRAILGLLASPDVALQLSGLRVLSSLAAGAAEGELPGEVLVPTPLLERLLSLIRDPATHQDVRCAALHALGNSAFDTSNRRRYLQSPGLMQLLVTLAAAPDAPPPPGSPPRRPPQRQQQQQQGRAAAGDSNINSTHGAAATLDDAPSAADLGPGSGQHPEQQQRRQSMASPPADAGSGVASPPRAAAAPAGIASCSPPAMAMQREASGSAPGAAAPEGLAMVEASSSSRAAVPAEPRSRSSSSAGGGTSSAAGVLSPANAMAAAGAAAAAAAAAGGSGDAAAGASTRAAALKASAAAAAADRGPPGGRQAAADAAGLALLALPKKRGKLVSVRDPVKLEAIRLLAVLGQNEQVRIALGQPAIRGRGLRVLAMDGGGMKGMAMVQLLRELERRVGAPIWSLFDVIGGTSTGGLLAVNLGLLRLSLDECHETYTSLGNKVFNNQSTAGPEDTSWRDSLYRIYSNSSTSMRVAVYGSKHDAGIYERLLREFCAVKPLGCASDRLIDTAVMGGPKVFVVATLTSSKPAAPFVFRNYELPEDEAAAFAEALAACSGSCKHHVWEAVRATSAAPYYFDDYLTTDSLRFQDGATTCNNPAVVALQQARLLHPQLPVDCVVSLGCGKEPRADRSKGLSTVIDTGAVLLEGAVSTERVHEALSATLPMVPGCQYFRFSAVDPRCAMELDDNRPESWARLIAATKDYCSRPAVAAQFDRLAALLTNQTAAQASAARSGATQQRMHGTQPQRSVVGGVAPGGCSGGSSGSGLQSSTLLPTLQLGGERHEGSLQQSTGDAAKAAAGSVLHGVQAAGADVCSNASHAPRLLFQRGVLLVGASCDLASTAVAAAAAWGVSPAQLQQQACVAQLLAAALPGDLVRVCDLPAAAASAAAAAAHAKSGVDGASASAASARTAGSSKAQEGSRHASPQPAGASAGRSADAAPRLGAEVRRHSSHLAASNPWTAQQQQQQSGASAPTLSLPAAVQRASDGGGGAAEASPKPASWLEYLLPWQQGGSSAPQSPKSGACEAANASSGSSGAAAEEQPHAGSPLSPAKGAAGAHDAARRATVGALAAAAGGHSAGAGGASSPDQAEGASPRAALLKARSLPPQPTSAQQQQQQQQHPEGTSRSNHSRHLAGSSTLAHINGDGSSARLPRIAEPLLAGATAEAPAAADGCGTAAGGGSRACAAGAGAGAGSAQPPVCDVLRSQLLAAGAELRGLGVLHLALEPHPEGGLVTGWQQRLSAVVEPGPEAAAVASHFSGGACSSMSKLVAAQGPLLAGRSDGALLAVLSQQQVLAPVPACGRGGAAAAGAEAHAVGALDGWLAPPAPAGTPRCSSSGSGSSAAARTTMQFVSTWLLQLTQPDAARTLGVQQLWPLLSLLQQLVVASSSWLPRELVHVLLRGGVAAVVCACERDAVARLPAAAVAKFFAAFYHGLWRGLDVAAALEAAADAVPAVGGGVYECCQLV